MLVTLVAVLCNSQICLEKIVTNSDQSSISMMDCAVHAQAGIAEWLQNGPYRTWRLARLQMCVGEIHSEGSGLTRDGASREIAAKARSMVFAIDRQLTTAAGRMLQIPQGVHIGGTDFDKSLSLSRVMPQLGFHPLTRQRRLELPKWCFVDLATWHRIQSLSDPKVVLELRKIRHEAERRVLFDRLLWIVNQRLGHRLTGEVEEAKVALTDAAAIALGLAPEAGRRLR